MDASREQDFSIANLVSNSYFLREYQWAHYIYQKNLEKDGQNDLDEEKEVDADIQNKREAITKPLITMGKIKKSSSLNYDVNFHKMAQK